MPAKKRTRKSRRVTYQGETYTLPIITKGRRTSRKDKIKVAELVCKMYATDSYTIEHCLEYCGVNSQSTWHNWTRDIEEIGALYQEAIADKNFNYEMGLVRRARTMTEKLIEGYMVETTRQIGEPYTDQQGQERMRTVRVEKRQVYVRPSVRLIETVLVCFDPLNFSRPDKNELTLPASQGDSFTQNNNYQIVFEQPNSLPLRNEDEVEAHYNLPSGE